MATLLDVSADADGVPAPVTNTVERITGHPARPFEEWGTFPPRRFRVTPIE